MRKRGVFLRRLRSLMMIAAIAVLIWYAVTTLLPAVTSPVQGEQAHSETDLGSYRAYFVEIHPIAGSDENTQAEWGLQKP